MKTNENQKSTHSQPAVPKPFFGATPEHAFFSATRAQSQPFFQGKAVSSSAIQAKSATSEAEGISQSVVQRMPAFESEVNDKGAVQRTLFNSPQQLSASPIQAKLTIGEPGDKYEQEADRVASQVVEQIHSPASAPSTHGESVQRQEEKKEELQSKPEITTLQRQEENQEELQTQPEITTLQRQEENQEELQTKSTLQRREAIAGGEASSDLTSAINSARGGGQPLEAGLQGTMGQAMGADFSGVRVHTDAQSDQLNRSIQAKAFTTGQDVFFRQGAYEPGNRGGQELIAHELTHVVQQNGGASVVQRAWPWPFKRNASIVKKGVEKMPFSTENVITNPTQNGTQQMVPSGKDLEELKNLLDENSEKFRSEWKGLTPNQAWALLSAEKKGEIQAPEDKKMAMKRLEELNNQFKSKYPTGEEADQVLEQIAKHIASQPIASNFNLSAPPGANRMSEDEIKKAPKTLAELLMEDTDGEFRSVWETGTSQASADLHSRAGVEEMFGYGSAVGRKTGKYQDLTDKSSTFSPDKPGEMPKYAALISTNQKSGVAPRYGASIIYWKENLRSRVTHTPGDSWGNFGGRFYTSNKHPLPLVAYGDVSIVRLMAAEATEYQFDAPMKEKADSGMKGLEAYFETQIHGKLSWNDVDRIVLNWGVFKNKEGKLLPNTSKEHAKTMLLTLLKFASKHKYDFRVQMGQEYQ